MYNRIRVAMKKIIGLLVILGGILGAPVFSQNKIYLSQNQVNQLELSKEISNLLKSSTLYEAYQFYSPAPHFEVKGTYLIFDEAPEECSQLIYASADGKNYSDIFNISREENFIPYLTQNHRYGHYYFQFDDSGRAFIATKRGSNNQTGVLMYSPLDDAKRFFVLPGDFQNMHEFAISNDGRYLVINTTTFNGKTSQCFLFDTQKSDNVAEPIFDSQMQFLSLAFSTDKHSFYIPYFFENYDTTIPFTEKSGIAVIRLKDKKYSKDLCQQLHLPLLFQVFRHCLLTDIKLIIDYLHYLQYTDFHLFDCK